jgi:hypothetical protein
VKREAIDTLLREEEKASFGRAVAQAVRLRTQDWSYGTSVQMAGLKTFRMHTKHKEA